MIGIRYNRTSLSPLNFDSKLGDRVKRECYWLIEFTTSDSLIYLIYLNEVSDVVASSADLVLALTLVLRVSGSGTPGSEKVNHYVKYIELFYPYPNAKKRIHSKVSTILEGPAKSSPNKGYHGVGGNRQ